MRGHIFVDAENFNPRVFFKAYALLKTKYEIIRVDIFSKQSTLPAKYICYRDDKKVHFINCFYGKNSADTFMCTSVMKALYEEALTDVFIIITEDKDFAPVVKAITDYEKQVILVTQKNKAISNIRQVGANMQYVTNMEISLQKKSKWQEELQISSTCFIKTKTGSIIEVPFFSGIDTTTFSLIAPLKTIRGGWGKNAKLSTILKDSYLKIVDGHIYYDTKRMLEGE